ELTLEAEPVFAGGAVLVVEPGGQGGQSSEVKQVEQVGHERNPFLKKSVAARTVRCDRGLNHDGPGIPVLRQLRQRCRFVGRNRTVTADREVNPAVAAWTAPRKAGVIPPGADQGIMNGRAVTFQLKVDALQPLFAPLMRTGSIRVDHMRSHLPGLPSLAV